VCPEILVLAAGRSARFGEDKRLAKINRDSTLLGLTLEHYRCTPCPLTVCLSVRSADDALAEQLADDGVAVLRCARAEEGMGSTLAEAAGARLHAPAIIVALGDMPLVSPRTVEMLCENWQRASIVAPVSRDGRRGHPVLFDRAFFPDLARLSGDQGGASLLRRFRDRCIHIAVDDPGIHLDADTPAALQALRAQLASRSSGGVSG
jgi:molybdenum cofactor cytidylyltransferase